MARALSDYLSEIISEHQDQPRFAAFLSIFLQGQVDNQNLLATFPTLFDVDFAVGTQLDAVGVRVGASRNVALPISGVYFSWDTPGVGWDEGTWQGLEDADGGIVSLSDQHYRTIIYATIAANHWDGTGPGAIQVWDVAFGPGMVKLTDHQDMTETIAWVGPPPDAVTQQLLSGGALKMKPAGVSATYNV